MKAITTMSLLAGSFLMSGAGSTEAQCYRTRPIRRVVISEPAYISQRPAVTYGGFSHIDELAVELEQRARDILWEMHFNYSHNPGYEITYSEAYSMLTHAKSIHAAEHRGHRAKIARVVTELDRLFHHIEDDIVSWRPSHSHFIGGGSLFDKVEAMEETLHHLMQDVGVEASSSDPPAPVVGGNPPPPSAKLPGPALSRFSRR